MLSGTPTARSDFYVRNKEIPPNALKVKRSVRILIYDVKEHLGCPRKGSLTLDQMPTARQAMPLADAEELES